jgi:predicted hotdog family 3-hydroxylacyl-ACP dehydratase
MTDRAWDLGRPVFRRLPYKGYQDNVLVDALTQWVDDRLSAKAIALRDFWQQTDPTLANDTSLDYAAYLMGFSEGLWNTSWTAPVKRGVLAAANDLLSTRGSQQAISKMLTLLGSTGSLWAGSTLVFSFKMPGTFGTNSNRAYIRMALPTSRLSYDWQQAEYVSRQWVAAPIKSGVCYQKFYLGWSVLGDPMF